MPDFDLAGVSRRSLVTTTCAGSLLGAAWALGLRSALGEGNVPTVTVDRVGQSIAALVEHRRRRILLLDAASPEEATQLTDSVTGFMRQRIDVLLAPAQTVAVLRIAYARRWRIQRVTLLPGLTSDPPCSLHVGELTVAAGTQVLDAWRYATADVPARWYVELGYHATQVLLVQQGAALERLPVDPAAATCVVINDTKLGTIPPGVIADAVAVPAESDLAGMTLEDSPVITVPMHAGKPLSIRMTATSIQVR